MSSTSNKRKWFLAGMAVIAIAAAGLTWQHLHKDHAYSHGDHGSTAELTLNNGKKWATDAPLRQGMQQIQTMIAPLVQAGSAQSLNPEQAAQVAKGVQEQVNYLITNCKLDPKADAVLHVLIADMLKGAEALSQPAPTTEGLTIIRKALEQYPQYFDHTDWKSFASAS